MTEGKPSRQSTHEANLRKAGWRRVGVWLSPDDAKCLERRRMSAEGCVSEQEAVRRAIRGDRLKWVPKTEDNTQRIGVAGERCRICRRVITKRYMDKLREQRESA